MLSFPASTSNNSSSVTVSSPEKNEELNGKEADQPLSIEDARVFLKELINLTSRCSTIKAKLDAEGAQFELDLKPLTNSIQKIEAKREKIENAFKKTEAKRTSENNFSDKIKKLKEEIEIFEQTKRSDEKKLEETKTEKKQTDENYSTEKEKLATISNHIKDLSKQIQTNNSEKLKIKDKEIILDDFFKLRSSLYTQLNSIVENARQFIAKSPNQESLNILLDDFIKDSMNFLAEETHKEIRKVISSKSFQERVTENLTTKFNELALNLIEQSDGKLTLPLGRYLSILKKGLVVIAGVALFFIYKNSVNNSKSISFSEDKKIFTCKDKMLSLGYEIDEKGDGAFVIQYNSERFRHAQIEWEQCMEEINHIETNSAHGNSIASFVQAVVIGMVLTVCYLSIEKFEPRILNRNALGYLNKRTGSSIRQTLDAAEEYLKSSKEKNPRQIELKAWNKKTFDLNAENFRSWIRKEKKQTKENKISLDKENDRINNESQNYLLNETQQKILIESIQNNKNTLNKFIFDLGLRIVQNEDKIKKSKTSKEKIEAKAAQQNNKDQKEINRKNEEYTKEIQTLNTSLKKKEIELQNIESNLKKIKNDFNKAQADLNKILNAPTKKNIIAGLIRPNMSNEAFERIVQRHFSIDSAELEKRINSGVFQNKLGDTVEAPSGSTASSYSSLYHILYAIVDAIDFSFKTPNIKSNTEYTIPHSLTVGHTKKLHSPVEQKNFSKVIYQFSTNQATKEQQPIICHMF